MMFDEFKRSLSEKQPPEVKDELQALWHDAKGDWEKAHTIVQDIPSRNASWIHAYLHRKEGDIGNAGYWYSRAGRPVANDTLEEEWERIVRDLL